MAHLRRQHVDRHVLHVRRVRFALDRVLHRRLAHVLRGYLGSAGPRCGDALARARERALARQPGQGRPGHEDPEEVRAHQQDQGAREGLQGVPGGFY